MIADYLHNSQKSANFALAPTVFLRARAHVFGEGVYPGKPLIIMKSHHWLQIGWQASLPAIPDGRKKEHIHIAR